MDSLEIWKPVVEFEEIYSVSNLGRVRRDAPGKNTRVGHILKGTPRNPKGRNTKRRYVILTNMPKVVRESIARIVATAFLGPRPNKLEVNHIDGDPSNNRADNLEYLSSSDNDRHAFAIGLKCNKGKNHPGVKLTEDSVRQIRLLAEEGILTHKKIGYMFGIVPSNVSHIKRAVRWPHLV